MSTHSEQQEDLGVPGEGFPEEEMTEAEFAVRLGVFGLIAQTVLEAAVFAAEEGYLDDPNDEAMVEALDDHLDMLDQLSTDTLMSHALLTLPDEYFYEA